MPHESSMDPQLGESVYLAIGVVSDIGLEVVSH